MGNVFFNAVNGMAVPYCPPLMCSGCFAFQMENLPKPWGSCVNWTLEQFAKYSIPACKVECYTDWVIEQCNCQELYMKEEDKPLCSPIDLDDCIIPHRRQYLTFRNITCPCPEPCEDLIYSTTESQATLAKDYYSVLAQTYGRTAEYWEGNVARVVVYFPELILQTVTHQRAYNILTLLCDIGGVFGLILGTGIISIVEVFDFIIVKACCNASKTKHSKQTIAVKEKKSQLSMF